MKSVLDRYYNNLVVLYVALLFVPQLYWKLLILLICITLLIINWASFLQMILTSKEITSKYDYYK